MPSQANQSTKTQQSGSGSETEDPLTTKFFEGNQKGAEAWRKFTEDGRYRLARADDFKFSDAAKKKIAYSIGPGWDKRIGNPYTGGDINHDEFYKDLAFIVVDTSRDEPERFGIVIFNEQEDNQSIHKLYWLYREQDLSQTIFGWSSGGLHIEKYNDDGTYNLCRIIWDIQRQEYNCK